AARPGFFISTRFAPLRFVWFRHPEVRAAKPRASKDGRPGPSPFERRYRGHLRVTEWRQQFVHVGWVEPKAKPINFPPWWVSLRSTHPTGRPSRFHKADEFSAHPFLGVLLGFNFRADCHLMPDACHFQIDRAFLRRQRVLGQFHAFGRKFASKRWRIRPWVHCLVSISLFSVGQAKPPTNIQKRSAVA